MKLISSIALLGLVLAGPLTAAPKVMPNPGFTKGEPIHEGAGKDWNLSAAGARGWMHSNKLATVEARQASITTVAAGRIDWQLGGRTLGGTSSRSQERSNRAHFPY